jgi:DNA polymerase III subunit delta'
VTLPPILGHEIERRVLAATALRGELPGAILYHGPAGIGKQRLALWLGQLLLCEQPTEAGPCDRCAQCRLAVRIEHPDLHWFFPLPRPRAAGSPEKLAEALEEARAAELAARRAQPYRPLAPAELAGLFLAQMQTLRRLAGSRPAIGRRKVFVIGDAERLVPQEASPEAANALLKLLEEPAADTTIVLTAAEPEALLPTIRSRLLPLRLRPLPIETLAAFLAVHHAVPPPQADAVARLAAGSLGAALAHLPADGEPGPLEALRQTARAWLAAATAADPAKALELAIAQAPSGARGAFSDTLGLLATWLRDLAAVAAGAEDVVLNVDALEWLRGTAARLPDAAAARFPAALERVETVAQWTQLNINPQLALSWLLRSLRRDLGLQGAPAPVRR